MIKNHHLTFIIRLLIISFIVGLYQLPLVENTALKYNVDININDNFPYFRNFQQFLENQKIYLSSTLDTPINDKNISLTSLPNINLTSLPIEQHSPITADIEQANNTHNINQAHGVLPQQCFDKCKILMIGDSVMGDVSFALDRLLKKERPDWKVIDSHKVSSGLSNQNYYNWPLTAKKLVEQYQPDYVYILVGTNDAQNFSSNGKGHSFGKEDWIEQYTMRVNEMRQLIDVPTIHWGWIQLPVVKDYVFNNRLQIIRNIQQEQTDSHFILTESQFGMTSDNQSIDMKLRANDGIHLNVSGANKLANILFNSIK